MTSWELLLRLATDGVDPVGLDTPTLGVGVGDRWALSLGLDGGVFSPAAISETRRTGLGGGGTVDPPGPVSLVGAPDDGLTLTGPERATELGVKEAIPPGTESSDHGEGTTNTLGLVGAADVDVAGGFRGSIEMRRLEIHVECDRSVLST